MMTTTTTSIQECLRWNDISKNNRHTGVDNEDLRGYDSATRIRDDIAPVQPPPYMASPPPYETVINEHQ